MTTWGNTDNIFEVEDYQIERVDNNETFDDYKKDSNSSTAETPDARQNTSWLVQEIPNISFLDISDTLLENKKTLHWRENWNVVVGTKWKSIEVVPQDFMWLSANNVSWITSTTTLNITKDVESFNNTTMSVSWWVVTAQKDWIYEVNFWWVAAVSKYTVTDANTLKWFNIRVLIDWTAELVDSVILNAYQSSTMNLTYVFSWGKSRKVYIDKWATIEIEVVPVSVTLSVNQVYLELQYLQPDY